VITDRVWGAFVAIATMCHHVKAIDDEHRAPERQIAAHRAMGSNCMMLYSSLRSSSHSEYSRSVGM
jgi:hypothetical protein